MSDCSESSSFSKSVDEAEDVSSDKSDGYNISDSILNDNTETLRQDADEIIDNIEAIHLQDTEMENLHRRYTDAIELLKKIAADVIPSKRKKADASIEKFLNNEGKLNLNMLIFNVQVFVKLWCLQLVLQCLARVALLGLFCN